ncbi:MAG TPA: ribonuclease [Candidatus Paenibacillus intestinavium]|nr:ribonuclease [Candidatus Paenibacillus intestinavium]
MFTKLLHSIGNKLLFPLSLLFLISCLLLTGCSELLVNEDSTTYVEQKEKNNGEVNSEQNDKDSNNSSIAETTSPLTSFEDVAAYIRDNGELPSNFIKKKDAEDLGWVASKGNLQEIAPHMSIGGDKFGNREGLLPKANGRIWVEADINYTGGRRNADRIVFSNDGLIYMTTDHYASFTNITEEEKQ